MSDTFDTFLVFHSSLLIMAHSNHTDLTALIYLQPAMAHSNHTDLTALIYLQLVSKYLWSFV
jgi:hypothetical protein